MLLRRVVLLVSLVCFASACGGGGDGRDDRPDLPAETAAAFDFWYQQGAGQTGQHIAVAVVTTSGEQIRLAVADVDKSDDTWGQLFRPSDAIVQAQSSVLMLNTAVYAMTESTYMMRIANELGGLDSHRVVVATGLALDNGRLVDVEIAGATLVVFPHELGAELRTRAAASLVFAHAAALASEGTTAYRTKINTVLTGLGWVAPNSSTAPLASDATLLTALGGLVALDGVFVAMGLPI